MASKYVVFFCNRIPYVELSVKRESSVGLFASIFKHIYIQNVSFYQIGDILSPKSIALIKWYSCKPDKQNV